MLKVSCDDIDNHFTFELERQIDNENIHTKEKWKRLGNLFNFKSIKQKILFGFSIIIVLVILLGVNSYSMSKTTNEAVESIANEDLPLLIASEGLVSSLIDRIAVAYGYIIFEDSTYKERFQEFIEDGKQFEKQISEIHSSDEFNELVDLAVEWREFIPNEVFTEFDNGNKELAIQKLQKAAFDAQEIVAGYKELASNSEAAIIQKEQEIISNGKKSMFINTVVTVVVVSISIFISLFTANTISRPIKTVMNRMMLIANGDLSKGKLETNLKDETGQLIRATNEMNENMKSLLQEISGVSEIVNGQSEELSQSANEVMGGTEQISSTMQELASAAEIQANHATELSSAMGIFSTKVDEASQNGEQVQEETTNVLNMTNSGSELMEASTRQMKKIDDIMLDAVKKVEELDKNSQEISKLVHVIQDIAEQTNLLALNAAIEAARAGEQGQGFAVVANEVRKLAEQVAASVSDITNIIENVHHESTIVTASLQAGYEEVKDGSIQIATTGETFEEISMAVTDMIEQINVVTDNLTDIAANTEEMNTSIQEVAATSEEAAAGVEETSAASQQTSASMEEVGSSSEELASLAEQLRELVSKFKL